MKSNCDIALSDEYKDFNEEQIENKAVELLPVHLLSNYFPSKDVIDGSLIIVKKPIDSSQQGTLVTTFGKDFEFYGRDEAIDTLWNGDKSVVRDGIAKRFKFRKEEDRNFYCIPVLASGPGTGKSRFLDEVEKLIMSKINKSNDESICKGFSNMVVINTTYGNCSIPFPGDKNFGPAVSISSCILFEYFRPHSFEYG
ncbi:hypothetical protein GLOIN_2v1815824 [Rhizophagus clarus]|uniref:Crinkler effector protein N-terminal domain-containing protein n=1 Tax=Rhizophagus clarus TaxID=94130 RepID=A0A8H3LB52_9GLOM|nr:hypothetical protein GLOIN_2v1815824 [Rhizophagus clarus]